MKFECLKQLNRTDTVDLLFYDAFGNRYSKPMHREDNYWYLESDDEIVRYKFVLNELIRLNDPCALQYIPDDSGEIWSVPNTDRTVSEEHIHINEYRISNIMSNRNVRSTKQKEFVYDRPLNLYFGISLSGVRAVHSITYICFQPDGRIYYLEEGGINVDEKNMCDVHMVFQSRISGMQMRFAEGVWEIQAFVDGRRVIKDYFVLKRNITSNITISDYST